MRSKVMKFFVCPVVLFGFQMCFAELPTAQELLDAHRDSRLALEEQFKSDKDLLKNQLAASLIKLDHQAQRDGDLFLRLWTHRSIRRLDELGENWLAIFGEPYALPDPVQQAFTAAVSTWNTYRTTAADRVLENRKETLDKMEKLEIRLVQEGRIAQAVDTRALRKKLCWRTALTPMRNNRRASA